MWVSAFLDDYAVSTSVVGLLTRHLFGESIYSDTYNGVDKIPSRKHFLCGDPTSFGFLGGYALGQGYRDMQGGFCYNQKPH